MIKGIYQFGHELRYLLKSPLSIVCFFLFLTSAIWIDKIYLNESPVQAIFRTSAMIGPFSTGLAIIFIIRHYLKDYSDTLSAYPATFVWDLLSKWLSVLTYMSFYTVVIIAVFIWSTHSWVISEVVFRNTIKNLLINMEASFTFAASIGLIIGVIFRKFTAYIIGIFVWLCGTYFIPYAGKRTLFLLPFKMEPVMNTTQGIEPIWSMILTQQEETSLFWVLITLSLFFLVAASTITVLRRPTKYLLPSIVCLLIALVFVGISVISHIKYWSGQFGELREHQAVAIPVTKANDRPRSPYSVTHYQIDIFRDGDMWTINSQFNVNLSDFPIGRTVSFTINPDFHVEQVTVNGRIVNYNQQHGFVDLSINDFNQNISEQTISVIYEGELEEWGIDDQGREAWYAFTKGQNFYLPAYLAWYPLPGKVPLYLHASKDVYEENLNSAFTSDPVSYTIRLHNLEHPVFSTSVTDEHVERNTQILTTSNQTGMTLFGGAFKTWESKNISAVIPAYYDHVRPQLTNQIDSLKDFLRNTFKKPMRGKFVLLPIGNGIYKDQEKLGNALTVPCKTLDHLSEHLMNRPMENTIIDYLLTGGKLLHHDGGTTGGLNAQYVQVINDLYHHEEGEAITLQDADKVDKLVTAELDQNHDVLLKKFLRTLLDDQRDPEHPLITKEEWNLTWESVFEKSASTQYSAKNTHLLVGNAE